MKQITAIIRPECLDKVGDALIKAGIPGMTVTDVLGRGKHGGINIITRGKTINVALLSKVQLSVVIEDLLVNQVIDIIATHANTGAGKGEGKIFISPIEQVLTISQYITEKEKSKQKKMEEKSIQAEIMN